MSDQAEPQDAADDGRAVVELDTEHTPEDIWDALTSDEGLARWMGTGATIVPEIDGAIDVPDLATGRPRQGHVDRLESGERLGFTWWPVDDPDETSAVTIELEPTIDGTRIRVTETATASATRVGAKVGAKSLTGVDLEVEVEVEVGVEVGVAGAAHCISGQTTVGPAWAWRIAILAVVGVRSIERDRIRA